MIAFTLFVFVHFDSMHPTPRKLFVEGAILFQTCGRNYNTRQTMSNPLSTGAFQLHCNFVVNTEGS